MSFLSLLLLGSLAGAGDVPLIVTGWDSPTPAQYRAGLPAFEAWGVFDGTTIRPTRQTSDGVVEAINAFRRETWKWAEFAPALADFRAARATTCRETYLMVYSNPGDVDWFDDAGWGQIVDHWRLLARLAKQGGLKGLLFDAEPYEPPAKQFCYPSQSGAGQHSYEEYRTRARQRGREVMTAVVEEFPEVSIFSYRLFSDLLGKLDTGDLNRALTDDTYGLLPSFVDGWLDVDSSQVTIIEGTEDIGYRANSPAEYDGAFTRLRLRMREFVAEEHRPKVDRQFRVGQSLYLDAHINPKGDPWHIDHTGSTAAARLTANIASARAASDGLVWLYGEQGRWWASSPQRVPLWSERFPGCIEAIQRALDPHTAARAAFAQTPAPLNLIQNANFAKPGAAGEPPEGWFFWQADNSKGETFSVDGATGLRGATEAVIGQMVPVQPAQTYAIRVSMQQQGQGVASVQIGWKDAEGAWTAHSKNRKFISIEPAGADGWSEIVGLLDAPMGVSSLVIMPSANRQITKDDEIRFRDTAVIAIAP